MAHTWRAWLNQRRFTVLLVSLLLLPVVYPLLSGLGLAGTRFLLSAFISVILFSSLYAISENKRLFIITLFLAVPTLGSRWMLQFFGFPPSLIVPVHIVMALFLIIIASTILSYVLRGDAVTAEKISASVCVYILIGLTWAFLFSVTYRLQPTSFRIENPELSHFVYYSFVTLSTLGYGDITPLSPPAQALSYVEAITGQLYLVVLVARLVALHIAQPKKE